MTVGLEVEFGGINHRRLGRALENDRTAQRVLDRVGTDSSCMSRSWSMPDGTPVELGKLPAPRAGGEHVLTRDEAGGEIIFRPMDWQDRRNQEAVRLVLDTAQGMGATPVETASIHIHSDASQLPWRALQALIRLTYECEAPLFRLSVGEMGYHRGEKNAYKYCRPLSSPISVLTEEGKTRPAFDIKALLAAGSRSELFYAWARLDLGGRQGYHGGAARLHVLNLAAVTVHGTVEYRHFNPTFTFETVAAWVALVEHLVEQARSDKLLQHQPALLGHAEGFTFRDLIDYLNLPSPIAAQLEPLWVTSPWPQAPTRAVLNHYQEAGGRMYQAPIDLTVPMQAVRHQADGAEAQATEHPEWLRRHLARERAILALPVIPPLEDDAAEEIDESLDDDDQDEGEPY